MSKIKEGDRIRIYANKDIWTGVVEKIYPNGRLDYISSDTSLRFGAHIKQCRKLVKKQVIEWWACNLVICIGEQTCVISPHKPENTDGWICLREVKKK